MTVLYSYSLLHVDIIVLVCTYMVYHVYSHSIFWVITHCGILATTSSLIPVCKLITPMKASCLLRAKCISWKSSVSVIFRLDRHATNDAVCKTATKTDNTFLVSLCFPHYRFLSPNFWKKIANTMVVKKYTY